MNSTQLRYAQGFIRIQRKKIKTRVKSQRKLLEEMEMSSGLRDGESWLGYVKRGRRGYVSHNMHSGFFMPLGLMPHGANLRSMLCWIQRLNSVSVEKSPKI
jgi:hypothetical protein